MIHWLAVAALIFAAVYEKDAEATTVGSMSVLHGDGYVTGEPSRMTTRFDVLAIKGWGDGSKSPSQTRTFNLLQARKLASRTKSVRFE